jgi:hypothetical protein
MAQPVGWSQDDWYAEGESQVQAEDLWHEARMLHFFSFPKLLVWTNGKKIVAQIEAWGGTKPERGRRYPNMKPRPTTPGGYVISGRTRLSNC